MSWIYHDSAIEGVVYTIQELKTAIDPNAVVVTDSSLQPACEEIRRHREALNFIRDFAIKKRQPVTLDVVKKIYLILHPEEGDVKTVRYRKDIPQHRLYFHEYAPPDKIAYKLRQIIDWSNDPETRRTRTPVRLAARAHYDLLRVFPFTSDSGKVGRLVMNLLLLRSGYPPAIIHSTERQRYYEALKGSSATMHGIVQDAIENSLTSIEKLLDLYEPKPKR
jgi:Fic family protein